MIIRLTYDCSIWRVDRTVKGNNITFDDEPTLPKLNNLSTHAKECRERAKIDAEKTPDTDIAPADQLNLKMSAEFMTQYLRAGDLNPAVEPTQRGFTRIFVAWILDESLPWTTGEAPSLSLLFKYLRIKFTLPCDTLVWSQLLEIYNELHNKIVHELMVCCS